MKAGSPRQPLPDQAQWNGYIRCSGSISHELSHSKALTAREIKEKLEVDEGYMIAIGQLFTEL
jgi:hypothetical protein